MIQSSSMKANNLKITKKNILNENIKSFFPDNNIALNKNTTTIEPLIKMFKYALTGTASTEIESATKNSIDILRTHRNSFSSLNKPTKSMVDFAVIMFIIIKIRETNKNISDIEKIDFNPIKNIFASNKHFKIAFKKFSIEHKIKVDNIPDSYLKSIKYDGVFSIIKLNNIDFDMSNFNSSTKSEYICVKNQHIRKFFNNNQINEKKSIAKEYFNNLIKDKINTIKDKDILKDAILKLSLFMKTINLAQRKFVKSKFTFFQLMELAAPVFEALSIKDEKEKIAFIEHSIFINFHKNNGLHLKRVTIQIPLITAATAALCATVIGAIYLASDWWFTIVGATVEGAHDVEGVGRDMIFEKLGGNFNVGDRLYSYTNSMKEIWLNLSNSFDKESDTTENINNKFKGSSLYYNNIKNQALHEYLKDKSANYIKIAKFREITENLKNESAQIRHSDLKLMDLTFPKKNTMRLTRTLSTEGESDN